MWIPVGASISGEEEGPNPAWVNTFKRGGVWTSERVSIFSRVKWKFGGKNTTESYPYNSLLGMAKKKKQRKGIIYNKQLFQTEHKPLKNWLNGNNTMNDSVSFSRSYDQNYKSSRLPEDVDNTLRAQGVPYNFLSLAAEKVAECKGCLNVNWWIFKFFKILFERLLPCALLSCKRRQQKDACWRDLANYTDRSGCT